MLPEQFVAELDPLVGRKIPPRAHHDARADRESREASVTRFHRVHTGAFVRRGGSLGLPKPPFEAARDKPGFGEAGIV